MRGVLLIPMLDSLAKLSSMQSSDLRNRSSLPRNVCLPQTVDEIEMLWTRESNEVVTIVFFVFVFFDLERKMLGSSVDAENFSMQLQAKRLFLYVSLFLQCSNKKRQFRSQVEFV